MAYINGKEVAFPVQISIANVPAEIKEKVNEHTQAIGEIAETFEIIDNHLENHASQLGDLVERVSNNSRDITNNNEDHIRYEEILAEHSRLLESHGSGSSPEVAEQLAKHQEAIEEHESIFAEYREAFSDHESRLENHRMRITNLEKGISPDPFYTDSSVAYIKDIPHNACPYAEVSKIGGMTYKTDNLILYPYDDGTSKTQNGLTFTVREDGAVVINGTQSGVASFNFKINNFVLEAGTYTLSGAPENAGNARLSIKDNTGVVVLAQTNGAKSGTFTLTERMACSYLQIYVVSGTQTFDSVVFYPMLNIGTTAKPFSKWFAGLRDAKVTAINVFNEHDDISNPDEARYTFAIPEAVQGVGGYGRGVNSIIYNYIDFERKMFVKKTKRIVFDGTEDWQLYDASGKYRLTVALNEKGVALNNNTASLCVCNLYDAISNGQTYSAKKGVSVATDRIFVYDDNYQTVASWKAYLAELYANGNPLVVEYALAEPIETDLSEYLSDDSFIEVEGGGSIIFENEHKHAVPSEITYMLKEVTK